MKYENQKKHQSNRFEPAECGSDLAGRTLPATPWDDVEEITYEDWWERYQPLQNSSRKAAFDGAMFETYGDDLTAVQSHRQKCIWTLIQGDSDTNGGDLWIVSGYHLINRIGYFITRKHHQGKGVVDVRLD